MKNGFLITIFAVLLISCNKDKTNDTIAQLKDKFHGKYEVISSVSKDAVDLNMDGIRSTDLLSENPEILNSGLELRILNEKEQLFEEQWPVEYISIPRGEIFDSSRYHTTYSINYALYINHGFCIIDKDHKSIKLLDDIEKNSINKLISIESILIEENEIIEVTSIRKIYTINGWITTKIKSRYKRYTKMT